MCSFETGVVKYNSSLLVNSLTFQQFKQINKSFTEEELEKILRDGKMNLKVQRKYQYGAVGRSRSDTPTQRTSLEFPDQGTVE